MKITVEVKGIEKMNAELDRIPERATRALMGALYREAERIMTASRPLVPVDTGALRSTGYVELPTEDGGTVSVELGYGGVAGKGKGAKEVGYAVYVHENLEAHHPVGQAKYLEQPVNQAKSDMGSRIIDDAKAQL